jgi:adenine phosphoribosyltransferase
MISDKRILSLIRDVQDFPKKGIVFKDITPLLADGEAFKTVLDEMLALCSGRGITKVVGLESRGFIFACALAYALGVGFVPVRKHGKLPCETMCAAFSLEYGTDKIEIHANALRKQDKVVLVDDLLATGGTMKAALYLVKKLGAQVDFCLFACELGFLKGREQLDAPVTTLIQL